MDQTAFLEKRFTRNPAFLIRKIADEYIIIPIRRQASEIDNIYTMDEVAGRIWDLVDGHNRVADICQAIVAEFAVDIEQATVDIIEFMMQLLEIGAVGES